jgi:hypothetical protein
MTSLRFYAFWALGRLHRLDASVHPRYARSMCSSAALASGPNRFLSGLGVGDVYRDIVPFRCGRFVEQQPILVPHEYVLPESDGHRV